LAKTKMCFAERVLYLRQFSAEVLSKNFLETALSCTGFVPISSKHRSIALSPFPRSRPEIPVLLLYLDLGCLADLMIELGRPLRALPCVTKQCHKSSFGFLTGIVFLLFDV
jgi:hypothetical protein